MRVCVCVCASRGAFIYRLQKRGLNGKSVCLHVSHLMACVKGADAELLCARVVDILYRDIWVHYFKCLRLALSTLILG